MGELLVYQRVILFTPNVWGCFESNVTCAYCFKVGGVQHTNDLDFFGGDFFRDSYIWVFPK